MNITKAAGFKLSSSLLFEAFSVGPCKSTGFYCFFYCHFSFFIGCSPNTFMVRSHKKSNNRWFWEICYTVAHNLQIFSFQEWSRTDETVWWHLWKNRWGPYPKKYFLYYLWQSFENVHIYREREAACVIGTTHTQGGGISRLPIISSSVWKEKV